MPKGGKRLGAGRPRGSKDTATRHKGVIEAEYVAFMLQQKRPLWQVQRERALGAYVLMVQTKTGYRRVTNPDDIERVLQMPTGRGTKYWFIEAQAPDAVIQKEINNRTMGLPTQPVEVGAAGGGPVSVVIQHVKD